MKDSIPQNINAAKRLLVTLKYPHVGKKGGNWRKKKREWRYRPRVGPCLKLCSWGNKEEVSGGWAFHTSLSSWNREEKMPEHGAVSHQNQTSLWRWEVQAPVPVLWDATASTSLWFWEEGEGLKLWKVASQPLSDWKIEREKRLWVHFSAHKQSSLRD